MFLMAFGGLFSAYHLSAGNNRALKIQLACSIGVLLIYLLIWAYRLNNFAPTGYGGVAFLVEMEAKLVTYFLNSGETMRGIQQVLWDVIPLWSIFWLLIFLRTQPKK